MSDPMDAGDARPLKLEDVSRAAAELAAEKELDQLLTRFLGRVREWASPSAVLAAVREPAAESGWRLLPALSFGSGPLGAERTLPGLIEETPGCLERPTLVHPDGSVPGVQTRDNWIVPWTHEGDFGVLVIRGVPRPSAANLGEALAVLSAPVWPRLLGGPASRVEALVVDLRRLAERLEADAARQIERLRAAQPRPEEASAADEAGLREELEAARRDAERAAAERDGLRERLLALETALAEAEGERDRARAGEEELNALRQGAERAGAERDEARERLGAVERALKEAEGQRDESRAAAEEVERARRVVEEQARASEESLAALRAEAEALRSEGEHSTLEWDELKSRVATLQEALEEAELERDRVRDESERLTARIESMQAEHASALEQSEERRRAATDATHAAEEQLSAAKKELDATRQEMERISADEDALKGRIALIEEDLQKAQSDRDEARAARERLDGERRSASDAARDFEETLASAQRELESARQEQQRAVAEAGEMRARVGSLEATLQEIEAERDGARGQAEILEGEKRVAEATARTAEEALASVRRQLEEAREGGRSTDAAQHSEEVLPERADRALSALRGTLDVLRRTPFVPPGLRVSIGEGEAVLDLAGEKPERWLRVVLLDRDAGSLVPLADELEEAGVDVRIANYPEELALLMKTPDAEHLNVAVCDILAFRPDQTVAGLFRGWHKDRPGLAFFLSFNPEDAAESERAKRVPISLTSGRLPRPIPAAELLEKLRVLAKKKAASEA